MNQKAKDEWAKLHTEKIGKMPSIDFHFGRDPMNMYGYFKIGIYWSKNMEAPEGEYIYRKRIELSFRSPFILNTEFYK